MDYILFINNWWFIESTADDSKLICDFLAIENLFGLWSGHLQWEHHSPNFFSKKTSLYLSIIDDLSKVLQMTLSLVCDFLAIENLFDLRSVGWGICNENIIPPPLSSIVLILKKVWFFFKSFVQQSFSPLKASQLCARPKSTLSLKTKKTHSLLPMDLPHRFLKSFEIGWCIVCSRIRKK